jgi:predicted transcriptional regulator
MRRNAITFRLDAEKTKALDALAAGLDRDRSWVLNEAVRAYLEVHRWQLDHIAEGVRQADAGKFASAAEVDATFARMRKGKR